uniref:Sorting nexin-13-like n=1 Tax=Saccoglossus kowalevskii TaxID=10224 RepID=A0ABM0MQ28_SACKO|nr:PREDICTED: sorting nexin-13-like [Saccoglossus kowalevskii]
MHMPLFVIMYKYSYKDEVKTYGWGILTVILFFTTFGLFAPVYLILYLTIFLITCVLVAYKQGCYLSEKTLHLTTDDWHLPKTKHGIQKLIDQVKKKEPKYKIDKRLTGAFIIDEPLQEVLQLAFRYYVQTWYHGKISDHEEFLHYLRQTTQSVIIAFSNRSKEVEWVPYLTRQLVDDFASHLRLFRKAHEKLSKAHRSLEEQSESCDNELESLFFDIEVEMEVNKCRDEVCTCENAELEYLRDVTDMLLFLMLPHQDFHNKPFRYLLREVIVCGMLKPMIDMITDPDYINQTIIWLSKETNITSDYFLNIIKISDSIGELEAVIEKLDHEISIQRSRDSSTDDSDTKMQLNSLQYVRRVCLETLQRLLEGNLDAAIEAEPDLSPLPGQSLYSLPLDVVLENNVALSYFIEFIGQVGGQGYLFFWLTIESYKVTAEQQLSAYHLQQAESESTGAAAAGYGGSDPEMLRAAALNIFEQYLSDNASYKLNLDDQLVKRTNQRIRNGAPSECVFDEIQRKVYDILQGDKFFPAFKLSALYVKCLAELDLLKDDSPKINDRESMHSADSSPSNSLTGSTEDLLSSSLEESHLSSELPKHAHYTLTASITNTAVLKDAGKSYAVYCIHVTRACKNSPEEVWEVYRRYSDFHDLHMMLKDKFPSLFGLSLPAKKAFNNMSRSFLDKRSKALDSYLQTLLCPDVLGNNPGMLGVLVHFLEPGVYNKGKGEFARKMDNFVNPLRNSVRNVAHTVKSVPGNIFGGMVQMSDGFNKMSDKMTDGINKMFKATPRDEFLETEKVSANIGADDDDNIPLRIMLLLMDEVFDLKSRDQWLRKRVIAFLRQIFKAAFGNMLNSKIVDYVEYTTSAEQVAEYVKVFRDSFWPNGIEAESSPERDHMTRMRTRVVAKAKLLSSMPDEMKNFIGAETTKKGVLRVFEMLQHQTLNKRLMYVCLEGMLETLFPDNKFPEVFTKLHSRSVKLRNKPSRRGVLQRSDTQTRGSLDRSNSHRKKVLERTETKHKRNNINDSKKPVEKVDSNKNTRKGKQLDRVDSKDDLVVGRKKKTNQLDRTDSVNSLDKNESLSKKHVGTVESMDELADDDDDLERPKQVECMDDSSNKLSRIESQDHSSSNSTDSRDSDILEGNGTVSEDYMKIRHSDDNINSRKKRANKLERADSETSQMTESCNTEDPLTRNNSDNTLRATKRRHYSEGDDTRDKQ